MMVLSVRWSVVTLLLSTILFALCWTTEAQQPKIYHIGVILPGGVWYETIDGLRVGLKQLGLEEGKQFILAIRDTKGDEKDAEQEARNLERKKVNLIYAPATSVTIAAKRVTADVPIVFCAGTDPVPMGLVESWAKPGGRLTGVYYVVSDLTAKRMEILKEILPKLRRVITFYDARNSVAGKSVALVRKTAQQLGIEFVERHLATGEELEASLQGLKVGEVDAYFIVADAVTQIHTQLIIDTARKKKLPTMFQFLSDVEKGGLAAYSVNFHEVGRMSARYVQRILAGAQPGNLPVERFDKIGLFVNLKTAKQIGLTIPPNVLARADRVIR